MPRIPTLHFKFCHLSEHAPNQCPVVQNPKVTEARDFNGFGTNFEGSPEPIYGTQFLPRKFKVAVTVPGDNSVDLFTNDIGVVVIMGPDGQHEGYNIVVGGGLGRAHRNADTFARMAEPIGYVDKVCSDRQL